MTRRFAPLPDELPHGMAATPEREQLRRRRVSLANRKHAIGAGNLNAAKHLAFSTVGIEADVEDEMMVMIALSPHLADQRFAPLVEAACRCIVRLRAADAAIASGDRSVALTSHAARMESQLARNLTLLGLVPRPTAPNSKGSAALSESILSKYRPQPSSEKGS